MKKALIIGIVCLLLGVGVFAESVIPKIPQNVVFPYISVPEVAELSQTSATDILFGELKANKLGNEISPLLYSQLKTELAKGTNPQEESLVISCAKATKGYYLRVVLEMGKNRSDVGIFELYDPNTLKLICKSRVTNTFGFSMSNSAKKLINKGTKSLADEVKKAKPDLLVK